MVSFQHLLNATLTGNLKDIPKESLNLETLLQTNTDGNSILHIAAKSNQLNDIPKELLDPISVLIENLDGETIIHIAAENGRLEDIPQSLITQNAIDNVTLYGQSIVHYAAMGGCIDKIPKQLLTKETFSLQDDNKETPLHKAGKHGHIKNVPHEFLTHELLTIKNNLNETVVHCVAHGDSLENLPQEILRMEVLRSKDKNNGTPIQNATRVGNISFLLTRLEDQDFLCEDKDGNNLLHLAAKGGCLYDIPDKFLTREFLFKKNICGDSPLDLLYIETGNLNNKMESLKLTLPKLKSDILDKWSETTKNKATQTLLKKEVNKRKVLKKVSKQDTYLEI
jgi:ankyrin repeat protein